mmetsp:Transcript_57048/g.165301  ORF Transcript_57048/g.165301 Transcript_57048/m.165301 type:complete len:237 (+) Transcript_57048:756-1466(+)
MAEDDLRRRRRTVNPSRRHEAFEAQGVQGREAAFGEAQEAHPVALHLPAHDAVRVPPRIVPRAEEIIRVRVPPLVDPRRRVRRVTVVAKVVQDDVDADEAQHVGNEHIAVVVGVLREAVLHHDAGRRVPPREAAGHGGQVPASELHTLHTVRRARRVAHQPPWVLRVEVAQLPQQVRRVARLGTGVIPLASAATRPIDVFRQVRHRQAGPAKSPRIGALEHEHAVDRDVRDAGEDG